MNLTLMGTLQPTDEQHAALLETMERFNAACNAIARDVNHVISKWLVAKAQDSGRGMALEDLKGIRERISVRKAQRRVPHS
ncbi:MAG: hypothetical protein C4337_09470 [Armatimonadota bacterium]